jgi:hypothetical protein
MNWIPCPSPRLADVIRWTEPVWAPPTKKRGKPDAIGEQAVTAEVKAVGEVYELAVLEVEVLALDVEAAPEGGVKPGDTIRRKKSTLERGECHRQS